MVYKSTEPVTHSGERGELLERIHNKIDVALQQGSGSNEFIISLNEFFPLQEAQTPTARSHLVTQYNWLFSKLAQDYAEIGQWTTASVYRTDEDDLSSDWKNAPFNIWFFLSKHDYLNRSAFKSFDDYESGYRGELIANKHYRPAKLSKSEKRKKSKADGSAKDSPYISLPRIIILAGAAIFLTIYFSGIETFLIGVAAIIIAFFIFFLSLKGGDSEET